MSESITNCYVALVFALAGTANSVKAQSTDPIAAKGPGSPFLQGTTFGMSADRFIPEGGSFQDGITLVSLRITKLVPQGFGVDAAVGVWPEGFGYAALAFGIDVGPAYSVALPNTTLLLKAGPSIIALVGTGGATGAIGGYVGGGIIRRLTPGFGVRFDAAEHLYSVNGADGGGTKALTLSLGVTSIPRPR